MGKNIKQVDFSHTIKDRSTSKYKMKATQYITIKNTNIPIIIRSYKTSKYLKMYFKAEVLCISKPKYVSMKKALEFIQENEEYVYSRYMKIISTDNKKTKQWKTGEPFYFKGEEYKVSNKITDNNQATTRVRIVINIDSTNKVLNISYPKEFNTLREEEKKQYIDKCIKKILKNNTEILLEERVPYWSKITKIQYTKFKVNDATSKFGSCIPKTKILHFSSRLIMLPEDKIDAIIVHELCHIIHPNHSKEFYNSVRKYIPNYDEINKWLKKNGGNILF